MFLQIFTLPITRHIFFTGVVINGLFVLLRGYSFMNIVWVSMVGGFVFCGIWAGIIKILMILLSERELSYFFNLSATSNEGYFDIDDDDDDLTMDELYNVNAEPEVTEKITSDSSPAEYPAETIDTEEDPEIVGDGGGINHAKTEVVLNRPDQFQITVRGKTLKAHPRDGANAIKKAIYDDTHKE